MQQAQIAAKNAAAVVVNFDAVSPSAGDGAAATWQATSLGDSPVLRPRLEMLSRKNAAKDGQKVFMNLFVPITAVVNSVTVVTSVIPFRLEATLADSVPDAKIADAIAYFVSIVGSPQGLSLFTSRHAPS